ncbi:MAG: hypothetical protein ACFFG0_05615 [Candidatus Thorarchaeota archaeon]
MTWWTSLFGMMGGGGGGDPSIEVSGGGEGNLERWEKQLAIIQQLSQEELWDKLKNINKPVDSLNNLGRTLGLRKTHKGLDKARNMFMAIRKATQSIGLMEAFMNAFKSLFGWMEPLLPIIELLGAMIDQYLAPAIAYMTELLTPTYKALANAGTALGNFNEKVVNWVKSVGGVWGAYGWVFGKFIEWLDSLGGGIQDLGISLDHTSPMMMRFNYQLGEFNTTIKPLNTSLGSFNIKLDYFKNLINNFQFPSYAGGGGGGGGGGGDLGDLLGDLFPGFQRGGTIKGSRYGTLIRAGEGYTDEMIAPTSRMGRADPELLYYTQQNNLLLQELIQMKREKRR